VTNENPIEEDPTLHTQTTKIEEFLSAISKPVPPPLLTTRPQRTNAEFLLDVAQGPNKRQSTRLAKKAMANSGKGTVQIAHDLLVRKLGDLGGTGNNASRKISPSDEFEFHAQHFARPLEQFTMEAIQDLIEHGEEGATDQENTSIPSELVESPGLVA
jgi:hypothetical protein